MDQASLTSPLIMACTSPSSRTHQKARERERERGGERGGRVGGKFQIVYVNV